MNNSTHTNPVDASSGPAGRRRSGKLICLFAPAILATLASLWPLERVALLLLCFLLGYFAFVILVGVWSRGYRAAAIASLLIVVSVATTNWPMRAAYALSRPSFDRVAQQIRAGEAPDTPCAIGLFRIHKAEVYHNGIVCLWTDDNPAGPTGFVQAESADDGFNLWSQIPLDDSWQFISED